MGQDDTVKGTPTDRLIDKVMKLLAKAEGTDNVDEAETFYAAATRLMEQHSIDEVMLRASGHGKQDEIGFISIEFGSTYWAAWRSSGAAVGRAFGFHTLIMENRKNGSMQWFGWKSDLALAELVWTSILIQAERGSRNFLTNEYRTPEGLSKAQEREDRFKAKRSFIQGFGASVAEKITEQRANTRSEAVDGDSAGSLLPVLVSREEQLNQFGVTPNYQGHNAGMKAGNKADIGNKCVGGRKQLEK